MRPVAIGTAPKLGASGAVPAMDGEGGVTGRVSLAAVDLLEAAPDAIIGVAPDGTILEANHLAAQLFGYLPGELLGLPVEALVPAAARQVHIRHRAGYLLDPRPRPMGAGLDLSGRRKDGTEFPAEISLSAADTAGGRIVWAFVRDATGRLRERHALEEKNRELEAANRELEAFSYSVSHDLRAPLRAISGFCGILLEDYAPVLDDEARRLLHVVMSNAARMGGLIEGLLLFARAGKELAMGPVDLTALARSAADETLQAYPDGSATIEVSPLPVVRGDARALRQVLVNLLGNALKFTRGRRDGLVQVGWGPLGGNAEVFVRDNGVGFDMRYVDKLFGVFQRLHGDGEFDGEGIGLAIVARIVRRHGGDVRAEGVPGMGATFFVTLPLASTTGTDVHAGDTVRN